MRKITDAKCTACGAPLKIEAKNSIAKCEYCRSEYVFEDKNYQNSVLDQSSPNLDKAVSELAIKRLKDELAELEPQKHKKIEELAIRKSQKIFEIEKNRNESLSSPTLENLKRELQSLQDERSDALRKGKTRLGFITTLLTTMGAVGGCVTFILAGFIGFFGSALVVAILEALTPIEIGPDQALSFVLLSSLLVAIVFFIWFMKFSKKKKEKLSQELMSQRSHLEEAIVEQENKIFAETSTHLDLVNDDAKKQRFLVESEFEAKKNSIEKEILERQEQLNKHYKRARI